MVSGNVFSLTKWGSGGAYYLQRACRAVREIRARVRSIHGYKYIKKKNQPGTRSAVQEGVEWTSVL